MPPLPISEASLVDYFKESRGIWHSMKRSLGILAQAITLRPGFAPKVFTVTTTPQRVFVSSQDKVILLVNPSVSAGLTTSGTLLASGTHASSNTQATPLSVGNFMTLRLFLSITITGGATNTITVNAQSQDPLSLGWATTQTDVFDAVTNFAVGTYYANLGTLGVDLTFAVLWTIGAGTPTWSLSYLLKDGLPGSGAGAAQTIFFAGSDGVNSTAGFALLEGSERAYFVPRDTEIWVVSNGSVTLKILELS